jgi:sporulation protein YlmC with PRC-barrel domain
MEDRAKGEVFIVYLNDDNQRVEAYVEIIEINGFVKFKTNQNIISIPRERVLKIKERVSQNGY